MSEILSNEEGILNLNIVEEQERYIEIYKITNLITKKLYVGQTVSHVLNHGKYRKYGYQKRLESHFSEAIKNNKDKQCRYLNNSIRKNGVDNFIVELITTCEMEEGDETEIKYIEEYNSLYPNGYNLTAGGKTSHVLIEGETNYVCSSSNKQLLSEGYLNSVEKNKIYKFLNVKIPEDIKQYDKYIKVFDNRKKKLIILTIDGVEASFGSCSLTCEQLKDNIIKFIDKLIKIKKEREEVLRNTLMRETPDPPKSIEDINIEKYEAYLKEKKQKKTFNYICKTCLVQKTKAEFRSHNHDCRKCENIKNAARDKLKNYNKKRKSRAKSTVVKKAS